MASAEKPIIVIKKKGGHGGHHGGAWKIAYADFVTAMMAFFLVMWLVNSASNPTKQAIASYFRRPGIFSQGSGTPLEVGGAGILNDAYVPAYPEEKLSESGEAQMPKKKAWEEGNVSAHKDVVEEVREGIPYPKVIDELQKEKTKGESLIRPPTYENTMEIIEETEKLEEVAKQMKQQLMSAPALQELLGLVDIKVDADGLKIEIMDTEKASMFTRGSAQILPDARAAFQKLTGMLKDLPNQIDILGHTDAVPFSKRPNGYSNWELSSDRANAARRMLEADGMDPARISSVVGKAETELKLKDDPTAAANRRITLRMRFSFDRTVDLSKNPDAISKEKVEAIEKAEAARHVAAPPTVKPENAKDSTHSFTTKEILEGKKEAPRHTNKKGTIVLPDGQEETPSGMPRDKIFGDNPVIGPPGVFSPS